MRTRLLLTLLAAGLLLTGACSDSKDDTGTVDTTAAVTSAPSSTASGITIKDFKFSPNPLTAKVGDKISVTNQDGTDHSATADDGSFDTDRFSSGTKTITVTKAGSIAFHCKVHSSMTGVIQVS
jgi:plastocyanin